MTESIRPFHIIVAMDQDRGIGKNNDIPWKLSRDLKYFKKITTESSSTEMRDSETRSSKKQNAVIMGRKTWESIPDRFRPLPDRLNVVLSRNTDYVLGEAKSDDTQASLSSTSDTEIVTATGLSEALTMLSARQDIDSVFVIGGGQLYDEALKHPALETVYITQLYARFDCDTHFPELPQNIRGSYHSQFYISEGTCYTFKKYSIRL